MVLMSGTEEPEKYGLFSGQATSRNQSGLEVLSLRRLKDGHAHL
jgi:hypothetical protein